MKKWTAIVLLIIFNVSAYFAGAWAVFGSMIDSQSIGEGVVKGIIFLAALPAPLVIVLRYFMFTYDFTKAKFFLCTLLPPLGAMAFFGVFLIFLGGYLGAVASFACHAVTIFMMISTVVWVFAGGRGEKSPNKAAAIVLLTVCGALILWRLFGLLNSPLAITMAYVYKKEPITAALVSRYVFGKLIPTLALALPVGFGVSRLMKIYDEDYLLKPPLFMLCAFAPSLIIAGVRMMLAYLGDKEGYFYGFEFRAPFDTFILTAALALVSALFYAAAVFGRSRRHYY